MQEKIDRYFLDCENELVDTLARLVAIKSVREDALPGMPFGKGPAEVLALALKMANSMGLSTQNFENYVGTVNLNDHETILGILCHLDVVGEGTGWSTPPYRAEIKDGMLYGRGVSDDKGPAVATLFALKAVKDLAIPLKYNARLILGTDEESGCSDIDYYFQRQKAPLYNFSPDDDFPVLNTEKGGLCPTFSKTWVVSAELPRVSAIHGGFRLNVVPPQAEARVEGLSLSQLRPYCDMAAGSTGSAFFLSEEKGAVKIAVSGKNAHASAPQKGCNAITALLTLLAALPLASSESASAIRDLNRLFPHGDYYGKALGIAQSDEISGALTLSFNIFEQTLTGFQGCFDSRTPLCATPHNSLDIVLARFAALGISAEATLMPSHHTPADSPFVKTLLGAYEQYTGLPGYCKAIGGSTYVHAIEGGVCFGVTMPGFEPNVHGADERIPIRDLVTAAKIFTQVIVDLCS